MALSGHRHMPRGSAALGSPNAWALCRCRLCSLWAPGMGITQTADACPPHPWSCSKTPCGLCGSSLLFLPFSHSGRDLPHVRCAAAPNSLLPKQRSWYQDTENMCNLAKDTQRQQIKSQEPGSSHLSPPHPVLSHQSTCHHAEIS